MNELKVDTYLGAYQMKTLLTMKKQPRDEKGRFLSWDGTHNIRYNEQDLKNAFMAGMKSQSRLLTAEKQWQFYREKMKNE